MNSLLTKLYNNYDIIYVQHSPKSSYIKHYNLIRVSHWQLTSVILVTQLLHFFFIWDFPSWVDYCLFVGFEAYLCRPQTNPISSPLYNEFFKNKKQKTNYNKSSFNSWMSSI